MRANEFITEEPRTAAPKPEIVSVQDDGKTITIKVRGHDGAVRALSNSNPAVLQQQLNLKYGLRLPHSIARKFVGMPTSMVEDQADNPDSWESQAADAERDAETVRMADQDAKAGGLAEQEIDEDLSRRGFLKGLGAAAVAGSVPLGAKAQSSNFIQLANYAVRRANEIVTSYSSVMTAERRSYFANYTREEIYKQTVWYLNNTGGYNAQEVIDYGLSIAKQECDNIKGGLGDMIGGSGLRDNMATKVVNTFVRTFASAMAQKVNEYKQQAGKQQQQQKAMGGLSQDEFDALIDGLMLYAFIKDSNNQNSDLGMEIIKSVTDFVTVYNLKEYVNSIYPKVRQSLAQVKQNPEMWKKEADRLVQIVNPTIIKLNSYTANKQPEFKESVEPGVAEAQLDEKSTSQAQFRTMAAAAHNPKFAKKVGIDQSVAKEFHGADRKQNYKSLPRKAAEDASWGMAPESKGYRK